MHRAGGQGRLISTQTLKPENARPTRRHFKKSVALLVLSLMGLLVGCGLSTRSYVLGGETPSATVASRADFLPDPSPAAATVIASDVTQPPPSVDPGSTHEETTPPPRVRLTPSMDSDHELSLLVDIQGAKRLTLRLTPLTLGEALAFLQGGQILTRQGKTLTIDASDEPDHIQTRIDLTGIEGWDRGLLAADAEIITRTGEHNEQSQLLQVSPFEVHVDQSDSGALRLEVTERGSHRAIPEALSELIDADGRVLARGRTDLHGHLELQRPVIIAPALLGPNLYLSVRSQRHQALIQL